MSIIGTRPPLLSETSLYELHHRASGEPPEDVNIYIVWLLYLANTVVSYLFYAYKVSVINAHQRSDITEKIGAVCRILFSVLQIIVVAVFRNIYLYVFLTVINSIAFLCVIIPNLIFALLNIRNSDFAKSMMFVRNILKRKH